MSTHEQSNSSAEYNGLLGPAYVFEYPGEEDTPQFAEAYSTVGTEINWEDHPDTATAAPETAEKRRALIVDESRNTYYLRGNTLYDLTESAKKNRLVAVELDITPIEDLVIGEGAALTSQRKVTTVIIAAEVPQDDQQKATPQTENPFEAWDKALGGLQGKGRQKKTAGQEDSGFIVDATWPERDVHAALEYRHHPTRPGMVTNLHPGTKLDDKLLAVDAIPTELSRYGEEVSPRSGVSRPTNYFSRIKSYKFSDELMDRIKALNDDTDPDEAEAIQAEVEKAVRKQDKAAIKKAKGARKEEYVGRQPGDGARDLGMSLEETKLAFQALFTRGPVDHRPGHGHHH
jgi:hypothetical protein